MVTDQPGVMNFSRSVAAGPVTTFPSVRASPDPADLPTVGTTPGTPRRLPPGSGWVVGRCLPARCPARQAVSAVSGRRGVSVVSGKRGVSAVRDSRGIPSPDTAPSPDRPVCLSPPPARTGRPFLSQTEIAQLVLLPAGISQPCPSTSRN